MQPYKGKADNIEWETTFDSSIKFKCNNCGLCCTTSNVFMEKEEVERIKKITDKDFVEIVKRNNQENYRIKGSNKEACMFRKNGRCEIYNARPFMCRLFPFRIVPFSSNKAYIDIIYECLAVLNNDFEEENSVNFNELVIDYYKNFLKYKKDGFSIEDAVKKLKQFMDKEQAVSAVWNNLLERFKEMSNLAEFCQLIDVFIVERNKIKGILKFSDIDKLIDSTKKFESKKEFEIVNNKITQGSKRFRGVDIGTYKQYSVRMNEIIVEIEHEDSRKEIFNIKDIKIKNISEEGKEFLKEYFSRIWGRKTTMQDFYVSFMENKDRISSLSLQLTVFKEKILLLQRMMDIIAEKNKNNIIKTKDIKEALLIFDMRMLNMFG